MEISLGSGSLVFTFGYKYMNTVTHTLLPVLGARIFGKSAKIDWKGYVIIGLGGALPDILNPHMTLESRLTSWSHGLLAWPVFSVIVLILSFMPKFKISFVVVTIASLAYLLHIFCDGVAGGVNWSYPISTNIWGGYWVSPALWIPLDIVLALTGYVAFRVFPINSAEQV